MGYALFFDDVDGALGRVGGFKGDRGNGEVELGTRSLLHVGPRHRHGRRRRARERARSAGINTVTAHTLGEENASTAVLRKNGFVRAANVDDPGEGTVWRWELLVAAAGDRQHDD